MNRAYFTGHKIDLPNKITVEEIKIPVPWGHVAGRWWGPQDKQPLIAIHGWQDNAGTWDNLVPLLPSMAILCIDLPGHGLSSHYPAGMNYYLHWDGLSLLRRIIKQFIWRKVSLMGHSLGGVISFVYAASFPDEVDSIICLDIASLAVYDQEIMAKGTGDIIDKCLKYGNISCSNLPCYQYEEMIEIVFETFEGTVSREGCKILMKRGMAPTPAHLKKKGYYFTRDNRLKESFLAMMSFETIVSFADKIKCKVLNIGMKRDELEYYGPMIEKMKKKAYVTYVLVEGTHHVHLNTPQNVACHIMEFLDLF